MIKFGKYLILLSILLVILFLPILFTSSKISGNYGDVYLHYYPLKYLSSEHIVTGKIPLWNPYIFAGQPQMANPQSAVFYPFSTLFYLLPLPVAFNYFIVLHFFLAGLFMYILLSYLKQPHTSSMLGSIAYTFSSFLIFKVPAGHPVALSGYVWLPLVILAIEQIRISSKPAWTAFPAVVLMFQFLSGHIQPIYISAVFILIHFVYNRFRYWKNLAIASAACILLCSVQLLPSFELSQISETVVWHKIAENYSLPFKNLINIFFPNYYGNIIDGNFISQLNPSYFFEKHALYIGIIPLLLALNGFFLYCRKRALFWPLVAIIGIFLAFGFHNPVYKWLYSLIPGFGYLRVPARFYFLTVIALIILASKAWKYYIKNMNKLIKITLLVIVILDLFLWGKKFIYAEDISHYRKKSEISGVINPVYRIATEPDRIPSNKSMLYHHYNLNGYETIFLKNFTGYLALQEKAVLGSTGLVKTVLTSPLSKGLSVGYHVTTKVIDSAQKILALPGGLSVYKVSDALPLVFLPKSVKAITDFHGYEQIRYLEKTEMTPFEEIVVAGMPADFPNLTEKGKIISYSRQSDRITAEVSLKEPGAVAFSDIFYPGWLAWAGRKKHHVFKANKSLRALLLQAGQYTRENRIFLYYDPISFRFGLYITLIALVFMVAYFIQYIYSTPIYRGGG